MNGNIIGCRLQTEVRMTNHPTIAWSLRERENVKNLFVHQVVRQLQLRVLLRTCPHWKVKRAMMHPRWKKLIRYSAVCCGSWPCIQVHILIILECFVCPDLSVCQQTKVSFAARLCAMKQNVIARDKKKTCQLILSILILNSRV